MHWNMVKASQAQNPTNHLTKHKCRAVMQPGHQVGKSYYHLLKVFNTFKPKNVHILSPKKCLEMFYFKTSQRKTALHFKYLI